MIEIAVWGEDSIRNDEMPMRMETQVGGEAMLTHKYPGLENFSQFTLAMSIHRGLPNHLTTEYSDNDLGDLAKQLGILKNPET